MQITFQEIMLTLVALPYTFWGIVFFNTMIRKGWFNKSIANRLLIVVLTILWPLCIGWFVLFYKEKEKK